MPGGGGGGHAGGFSGGGSFGGGHSGGFSGGGSFGGGHSGGFSGGSHSSGSFGGGGHPSGNYGGGGFGFFPWMGHGGGYRRGGSSGCGCGIGIAVFLAVTALFYVISGFTDGFSGFIDDSDSHSEVITTERTEVSSFDGDYLCVEDGVSLFTEDECSFIEKAGAYFSNNYSAHIYIEFSAEEKTALSVYENSLSDKDAVVFSVYREGKGGTADCYISEGCEGLVADDQLQKISSVLGATYQKNESLADNLVAALRHNPDAVDSYEGDYITVETSSGFSAADITLMEDAMREYEGSSSVTPYIIFTDSLDGNTDPASGEAFSWLYDRYLDMFSDEMHILYVYIISESGTDDYCYYIEGDEIYSSIDEDVPGKLFVVLSDTYDSPSDFAQAAADFFSDESTGG